MTPKLKQFLIGALNTELIRAAEEAGRAHAVVKQRGEHRIGVPYDSTESALYQAELLTSRYLGDVARALKEIEQLPDNGAAT